MKTPTDPQTNATLLALGLLSDADARTVAASVHQNMPQRLQAAAVQDIATALLLSGSAPAVTPPPAVLAGIQKRVAQSQLRRKLIAGGATALRWSGWGAAAAMALLLARTPESPQQKASATAPVTKIPANSTPAPSASRKTANSSIASADLQKEVQALRSEVATLRAQVTPPDDARRKSSTISVLSYSRNGKATPLNSILPSGSALANVVATALKPYLVKQGSNQTVGPEIVIEQGFGAFTASTLPEGYYFRHQHFPADDWQTLGLLSAADGSFYDPNGQLVWQPDPTNPGSYIGYAPTAGFDFSRYDQAPTIAANTPSTSPLTQQPGQAAPNPQVASSNIPAPQKLTSDPSSPAPRIIAVIDPSTNIGKAIMPDPPISPPGYRPVVWGGTVEPTTKRMVYTPIGTPEIAQIRPSDLPKGSPVITYTLTQPDTLRLSSGPIIVTSEPIDVPLSQPTGNQTIIVPPAPTP